MWNLKNKTNEQKQTNREHKWLPGVGGKLHGQSVKSVTEIKRYKLPTTK